MMETTVILETTTSFDFVQHSNNVTSLLIFIILFLGVLVGSFIGYQFYKYFSK